MSSRLWMAYLPIAFFTIFNDGLNSQFFAMRCTLPYLCRYALSLPNVSYPENVLLRNLMIGLSMPFHLVIFFSSYIHLMNRLNLFSVFVVAGDFICLNMISSATFLLMGMSLTMSMSVSFLSAFGTSVPSGLK